MLKLEYDASTDRKYFCLYFSRSQGGELLIWTPNQWAYGKSIIKNSSFSSLLYLLDNISVNIPVNIKVICIVFLTLYHTFT